MKNPDFQLGDTVIWTSQARGSEIMKIGKIVLIVHPETSQRTAMSNLEKLAGVGVYNFLTLGNGTTRNHESYFVAVQAGKKAMPKIYQPLVSKLQKMEK